jgi:hypothetical protein
MSCVASERLAALAAGEPDVVATEHVTACDRCREALDEQLAVRALVRQAPARALDPDRRAALAAEVLAVADAMPAARRSRLGIGLAVALAAVAGVALVLAARQQPGPDASGAPTANQSSGARTPDPAETAPAETALKTHAPARTSVAETALKTHAPAETALKTHAPARTPANPGAEVPRTHAAPSEPVAKTPAANGSSGSRTLAPDRRTPDSHPPDVPDKAAASVSGTLAADFVRETTAERDVVTLRDGQLAVDAVRARPVRVVAGTTRVEIAAARASITARHGIVESVTVFAGSVEVSVGTRRQVIEAGMVWEPAGEALRAFREGWTALRDGKHAEAIAAFDRAVELDRATAPVVAEDAAYWAAIASERSGDRAGAKRRYTEFLAKFPHSPRADTARAASRRP